MDILSKIFWPAALLVPLVLATGCQTGPGERYALADITGLEIIDPVTIPPGSAHTVFQSGRAAVGIDPYRPHCELEISTVAEQVQQIEPDRLAVTRGATAVLSDPVARLPLAGPFVDIGCGDMVYYESRYWLRSDRQPGVRTLSCRQAFNLCWGDAYHLTREDMSNALGSAFRLD